jgi:hypothetical protein
MKTLLIIIGFALLIAGVVVLVFVFRSRPDDPIAVRIPDLSPGPAFEVRVRKPRSARPLGGILPIELEQKLFGGSELRFGHTSGGAMIGSVGKDHLELRADGWDLLIETDAEGRVGRGTHLVFPIFHEDTRQTLRCRPENSALSYLQTTQRVGSGELDGSFLVELVTCENIETGKQIEWRQAPLTVRGGFKGLPRK